MSSLHTEGKYIKDANGNIVSLRGCAVIEPSYNIDKLRHNHTVEQRAARLKELGVNFVRLQVNKPDWDANTDTNGDGIGNRDFILQMAEALSNAGIMFITGPMAASSEPWAKEDWANWIIDNMVTPFQHMPNFVGVFILNEPHTEQWGGTDLGQGVMSGYWEAAKYVCQRIYDVNPNLLKIVHATSWAYWGFSDVLKIDPIAVPNTVYTWHYYYCYAAQFDPYMGFMTGVLDPDYEYLKQKGMPFYQSYYLKNYAQAKAQFEQYLHNRWLWATDLNLSVINDEFGFNGDEESYFYWRACPVCLARNNGVTQREITFWHVADTLDAPGGNPVGDGPYPNVTYCPICGEPLPRPREHTEPGWPQCMRDFIEIMNKYNCSWSDFAWWVKTYSGYGLAEDDTTTLSKIGQVWAPYLTPLAPPKPSIIPLLAIVGLFLLAKKAKIL